MKTLRKPVSRRLQRVAARSSIECLEARIAPAAYTWTAPGGGDFGNSANWTLNGSNPAVHAVPGSGDDASIGGVNGTVTITSGESESVRSLNCATELDITGGGALTVANMINNSSLGVLVLGSGSTLASTGGTTTIGGSNDISGTFNVGGAGTIVFNGGTTMINSGAAFTGLGAYQIAGGTWELLADTTAPQNLQIAGGTVTGPHSLIVPSGATLAWTGGVFNGPGATVISSGATLNILGVGTETIINGYTLTNQGTFNWGGTGGINEYAEAVINNSGSLNILGTVTLSNDYSQPGVFNNTGAITQSNQINGSVTGIVAAFNNSGTVNVQSGQIALGAGGAESGVFNVSADAVLSLSGGSFNLDSGATGTGAGLCQVDTGSTVTVNAAIPFSNFNLFSGTVNGIGTLTVSGTMNWEGGQLSGAGTTIISSGATLNILGVGTETIINGYTLTNHGTFNWGGTGGINEYAEAVINNSGSLNILGTVTLSNDYSQPGVFNNTGTITQSSQISGSVTGIVAAFNNSGTVNVQSGQIALEAGGVESGVFNVSAGAVLSLSGGTFSLDSGATGTGAGACQIDSGSTVAVNATIPFSNFNLFSGTVNGTGTVTVSGTMNWEGGQLSGAGTTIVSSGATLNILGVGTETIINGYTLTNQGTFNWGGTGGIDEYNEAVINNSGSLNILGTVTLSNDYSQPGVFNNTGTITQSSQISGGVTSIDAVFNNNGGTVNVQSGHLAFTDGGAESGVFNVSAGAVLSFSGGIFNLDSDAAGIGAGFCQVDSSSTVTVNAATPFSNFNLFSGTVNGTGTLTVSGTMNWTGGDMDGGGTTAIASGGMLNISSSVTKTISDGYTLSNHGTIDWSGSGNINGYSDIVIDNIGVFNIQGTGNLTDDGTGVINNSGTINAMSSGALTDVSQVLNDTGTIAVQSGVLQLENGGADSGVVNVSAGASFTIHSGTYNVNGGASFTGTGEVTVAGGELMANAAITIPDLAISGGTLLADASVAVTQLALSGGSLDGTGLITISGALNWTGGTMAGSTGQTLIASGAVLDLFGNANKTVDGRTLQIAGMAAWSDSGAFNLDSSGVVSILSSGVLTIESDTSMNGDGVVQIMGALQKTGGLGTTTIGNGISVANDGGSLLVSRGTVDFGAAYIQNSGTTTVSAGATLESETAVNILGGTVIGSGKVVGDVNAPPPEVLGIQAIANSTHTKISEIMVTFSEDLNYASAVYLGDYLVKTAGKDMVFGTKDDGTVALASAVYNPLNATVTLTPKTALALNTIFELTVDGSNTGATVTSLGGDPLGGGSNYVSEFGFGTSFSYKNSNLDGVSLKLTHGGDMEIYLKPTGEVSDLSLIDAIAASVLAGSVKKAPITGTGLATIDVLNLGPAQNELPSSFSVDQIT